MTSHLQWSLWQQDNEKLQTTENPTKKGSKDDDAKIQVQLECTKSLKNLKIITKLKHHQAAVCDNTQNMNKTESEYFFPGSNLFNTESDTFFLYQFFLY